MKQFSRESQNTTDTLRPEDFPVGSPESRAAARALLSAKDEPRGRTTVIISAVDGSYDELPCCTRSVGKEGFLVEIVDCPNPAWTKEQLRAYIERHPISRD